MSKTYTYQEKVALVKSVQPGAVWRNRKTGRTAEVVSRNGFFLTLKHESGRQTEKEDHYFAGDFDPI